MQFIILGAGPGLPNLEKNLSAVIVQTTEGNFLADCGEGTSRQLLKHGFNKDYLDAVFISHYHPDHVSGLYMLLQMLYLEDRTKPLDLFLPERTTEFMDSLHMFYTFESRFAFTLIVYELKDAETLYPNVSVALTDHLTGYKEVIKKFNYTNPMQSYSLAFSENRKTLVYTSDLWTFKNVEPFLDKADVIIMDAIHPAAELIISYIQIHDKRVILTHGISEKLNQWFIDNPKPGIELAQEDRAYTLL